MHTRKLFTVFLPALLLAPGAMAQKPVTKKTTVAVAPSGDAVMNAYVTALMKRMTVEEKIGQLNLPSVGFDVTGPIVSQGVDEKIRQGQVGGVFNTYGAANVRKLQDIALQSRMKIPLLFGYDVIHGHRTIFPIPLGISASWDMGLIERTARAAAEEASADGLNWTFSPMVDIARDARWGRIAEGGGEDPVLGSYIARAMVRGYQGSLTRPDQILACIKHFALYGASESGRDYNVVDMSLQRMYNEYLPPYKAALDAGAATVMTSFNEINGVPATANKWLFTDLLRKQWGFKGMVVTDYTAINELVNHGLGDLQAVSAKSLAAGIDMDMVGEGFLTTLKKSLDEKKITLAQIDGACRNILNAKYRLGLFENPYRFVDEAKAATVIMNADKLALSREAASKSFVLLKNERSILPLAQGRIAWIGPLVKNKRDLIGNWSGAGDWKEAVSIWEALETRFPGHKMDYALGTNFIDDAEIISRLNPHGAMIVPDSARNPQQLIDEAVAVAQRSDVVVVAVGEPFGMSGEAASRSNIELPENQQALLKALHATGKPVVLVLMNGRPLALQWEHDHLAAILETWYPGTRGGEAIVGTLFGATSPSGKLSASFPRVTGQVPIYYNHKNTGRPFDAGQKYTSKYLDVANTPLYPFGHGLSYTSYSYSPVRLDKTTIDANDLLTASVTVTNSGSRDGEETVQLYLQDIVGSITRPVKELKGFQKVQLRAGESKEISFRISVADLKFFNNDLKWVAEPGEFNVFIGGSSADLQSVKFTLK